MTAGLDDARLSILVHEVRSPVAALSAVAETMRKTPVEAAMRRELVRLALAACAGIERIVLDVAVASVRLAPLDVGTLVREAIAAFAVQEANVMAEVADDALVVDGDRVRLRQAVDNLVVNALVHGDGTEAVTVHATRSGHAVVITVSNAGVGVRPEDLSRIFELGVRLSDGVPGSGLGLPLTREIIDAHGGALEVESTLGEGTTFKIVLPARVSHPAT
jgi:signal transduction histidine kinase